MSTQTNQTDQTSRPEAAFVLLVLQATFWAMAGLTAFPFALAGQPLMIAFGLASLLLADFACLLGIGLLFRWRWVRGWVIGLESVCVAGSLLLLALPVGANKGPVALMVNLALPLAVVLLVRGKKMRAAFAPPLPRPPDTLGGTDASQTAGPLTSVTVAAWVPVLSTQVSRT